MTWEERAIIIYEGTKWEYRAIHAGRAMDNRLNGEEKNLFGDIMAVSFFDIANWFAYFDGEVLARRGLGNKEIEYILTRKL